MAELFFFLPMILFFGVFALLVIGFFGIIAKLIKKTKADIWEGKLVDKKYAEKEAIDSDKTAVSSQAYAQWKIGDKAKKEKGKIWPTKIS